MSRYHRTHRTIISWSKCRPLKSSCAEAGSVIQAVTAAALTDVRLLDLVLQRFCPQRPGADDAQDDQRQPDAERPADAEMLGDITEQWRSQQERDERDLCQRCNVS